MDAKTSLNDKAVAFRSPETFLSGLDAASTGAVVASAADFALVVEDGVIRDMAIGNGELVDEGYDSAWIGKPWVDTVTVESRPKIEALLQAAADRRACWRQVNHPTDGALDLPVRYTAVPTAGGKRVVALGRELRAVSSLQQRLVEAHQGLERDYARLREAEARYKLLFDTSSEPVLVVDAQRLSIEDVNPAAARAVGATSEALAGAPVQSVFDAGSARAVERLAAKALTSGAAELADAKLSGGRACGLSASAYRHEGAERLIVRLSVDAATRADGEDDPGLLSVLEHLPDGFLVASADLRVLAANRAFLEMAYLTSDAQLAGAALSDYLGRSASDLNVLVSYLRNHGALRNFATVLRDRFGGEEAVEVSAVAAPPGDHGAAYGFSVRGVARRLNTGPDLGRELPRSVDQLTSLVGRVPLKDIVRQSTDLIERLCIDAALEITDDNRASAAEMLGLSRQGLYSKLKRFGFDEKT